MTPEALREGLLPTAAVKHIQKQLEAAGCDDADFDAAELVRFVTGRSPRFDEKPLTGEQIEKLRALTERRCWREPLQYLEGSWPFLDMELAVGPGVLIPRSDTETVCLHAAETLKNKKAPSVLELCSGSGCLALGIRRLCPEARVLACEKSPEAFVWLSKNIEKYAPNGEVKAVRRDLFGFEASLPQNSFDLILSNPPYLTRNEMNVLQPEVRFEPAMALDGGEDGLLFYRYITEKYFDFLKPGGCMAFEIGFEQGRAVEELLKGAGAERVSTLPDLEGRDRTALGFRPVLL